MAVRGGAPLDQFAEGRRRTAEQRDLVRMLYGRLVMTDTSSCAAAAQLSSRAHTAPIGLKPQLSQEVPYCR